MVTNNNNPDLPKKPKRTKTPKKVKEPNLTPDELMELIMDTMAKAEKSDSELNATPAPTVETKKPKSTKDKDEKMQEIIHLESVMSEFLSSFIVIGYNLEGEKVFIGHAKSQQQHDALVEHLRVTFFNIINGQQ